MFKIGLVEFDIGHNENGATYGDQTVYQVEVAPGTLAAANAMRWQLQGQKGSVVGVTWDDDPMIDGIYIQADVSVTPISNYLATGRMAATVVLQRVPDIIEASYRFSKRTDLTPSFLFVYAPHALTSAADLDRSYVSDDGGFVMNEVATIGEPDGTAVRLINGFKAYAADTRVSVQQGCVPSMFDLGRCRIEVSDPDGAYGWWTLTGKQVPEGHDLRITNGRVRTTVSAGSVNLLQQEYSAASSSWVDMARNWFYWNGDASNNVFTRRFKILRNDRASVVVRCPMSLTVQEEHAVDISVVRGSHTMKMLYRDGFSQDSAATQVGLLEYDGTDMATQVSGTALRRTATTGGLFPYLWADTTGVTLSTVTDNVAKTSSAYNLVGAGGSSFEFAAEVQVFDRLVY
jgi:hypothetical protein